MNSQSETRAPGRRNRLGFPKGRVLDPADSQRLGELTGKPPYARDLLIEYLHVIQDAEGCLPAGLLQALAQALEIPMAEVFEVATFYAHFDVVRDGEPRPAPVTVRVCDSITCTMEGAEHLLAGIEAAGLPDTRVVRAPCMGRCHTAPTCEVGHRHVDRATVDKVAATVAAGNLHPEIPVYEDLAAYRASGGFTALADCLAGKRTVDDVIAELSDAGLRGLGGAGFPTGRKWDLVRQAASPRLMAVNADEGEPGTFKDRHFFETRPCAVLEGTLIAAWAVAA